MRDSDAGVAPRRGARAAVAGATWLPGLLAGAVCVWAWAVFGSAGQAWLALALPLIAVGALASGVLWSRQQLGGTLGELRRQHALASQLVDAWQWQTDSGHRLLRLQPPADTPAAQWPHDGAGVGHALWQLVDDADGTLRARLQAHSALDLTVRRVDVDATGAWRLRGLPWHDRLGLFAGYVGVLSPLAAALPDTATAAGASAPMAEAAAAPPPGDLDRAIGDEHAAFVYTASHDLRAPIRVVDGFARILKEDYGAQLDRIGNDHLDRVLAAAARMNQMIDALLSLSRLSSQPLARQTVDLSQMASWVVDELQREAPEREVKVHIANGLCANGDPTLLRMLLDNLIGNAWKYCAKTAAAEIRFEQTARPGGLAFVVSDNGVGFDMRFAERLFGVFQRLHSASDFPGNGVGLASVRRIVRRHGGEVWADGEVGRGARFYFTLPG